MEILDAALAGGQKVLPGDVAFKLHDTYGFPLDLSADVCRERGVTVDEAGFNAAMEKQKAAGRAAGKFKMDRALEYAGAGNVFTGYEKLEEQRQGRGAVLSTARRCSSSKEGQPASSCWTPRPSMPRAAARSATAACSRPRACSSAWKTRRRSRPTSSATTARRRKAR
jgi:hypothetical protein